MTELRLAAAEQRREHLAEVAVDRVEGRLQQLARLAVDAADRVLQGLERRAQVGGLRVEKLLALLAGGELLERAPC